MWSVKNKCYHERRDARLFLYRRHTRPVRRDIDVMGVLQRSKLDVAASAAIIAAANA